jgi:5-methylcytosine-specific restriction endonuclease McrA
VHVEGRPCKKCNGTLRYARHGSCVACGRAHAKEQRSGANKPAFLAYMKDRRDRIGHVYRPQTDATRAADNANYHRHAAVKAAEKAAAKAAYESENAELIATAAAEKKLADGIRKRAYMLRYRRENPIKTAAQGRTKRARRRNAPGKHTGADVIAIGNHQKWRCAWCRKACRDAYHVDHVVPLAKGGSNWPDNLAISCPTCNMRKKDKLPHEWAAANGRLL